MPLLSQLCLPIGVMDFGAQNNVCVRIDDHRATSLDLGGGLPGHDEDGRRPDPNAMLPIDQSAQVGSVERGLVIPIPTYRSHYEISVRNAEHRHNEPTLGLAATLNQPTDANPRQQAQYGRGEVRIVKGKILE